MGHEPGTSLSKIAQGQGPVRIAGTGVLEVEEVNRL